MMHFIELVSCFQEKLGVLDILKLSVQFDRTNALCAQFVAAEDLQEQEKIIVEFIEVTESIFIILGYSTIFRPVDSGSVKYHVGAFFGTGLGGSTELRTVLVLLYPEWLHSLSHMLISKE